MHDRKNYWIRELRAQLADGASFSADEFEYALCLLEQKAPERFEVVYLGSEV